MMTLFRLQLYGDESMPETHPTAGNLLRGKWCAKFTLIELLIVIAIIAILAALLLPALQRSRDTARSIRCVQNLRNHGQYLHMYADHYNGFILFSESAGNGYTGMDGSWVYMLLRFVCNQTEESTTLLRLDSLRKTVFHCPGNTYEPDNQGRQFSYGLNRSMQLGNGSSTSSGIFRKKFSSLKFASRTMLVACQGHNTSSLPAAGNMYAARGDIAALLNTRARIASKAGLENEFLGSRSMVLQMRHGGGAYTNLLWADGHSGHCQGGDLPLANYTTGPFWTGKQK